MSGRERFKGFLNRDPTTRPAFVPMIRGLLSRIEGVPMERLTSDPTLWANSLMKTTQLFGFDGLVAGLDFTLMAEACGCRIAWRKDRPAVMPLPGILNESPEACGRMKHALETARRLFETCRSGYACVAALTGPVTLASQLFGEQQGPDRIAEVKPVMVRGTEAFCANRPDVLIFLEDRPLALGGPTAVHRRMYNTLKNIASHYDVSSALYLQGYRPEDLTGFAALNMDIYILGPADNEAPPPVNALWDLGKGVLGVGIGLPLDDVGKAMEVIDEGRRLCRQGTGQSFFLTSLGPLTRDVDLGKLHSLVDEILRL